MCMSMFMDIGSHNTVNKFWLSHKLKKSNVKTQENRSNGLKQLVPTVSEMGVP